MPQPILTARGDFADTMVNESKHAALTVFGSRSPAELATLATRGVDRLDGYFARYLPQLLIAATVPAAIAARILLADWVAAFLSALALELLTTLSVAEFL